MPVKRAPKSDGFGPAERKSIHAAVRLVWQRSLARRLAIKRATDLAGYVVCEACHLRAPKGTVDHIEAIGEVGGPDYIQRMFVPSAQLRVLCLPCHSAKTREERKATRAARPRKG